MSAHSEALRGTRCFGPEHWEHLYGLIEERDQLLEALQSYSLPIDTNNIALSCIEFGAEAVERELKRRAAITKAMGAA